MYGEQTIRTLLGQDLVAAGFLEVDLSGQLDPNTMAMPAAQLSIGDATAEVSDVSARRGVERLSFVLDAFASEGDWTSDVVAAADVRNALESPTSAVRTANAAVWVIVSSWEYLEGAEVKRSAKHRIRFRVDTLRNYIRGEA